VRIRRIVLRSVVPTMLVIAVGTGVLMATFAIAGQPPVQVDDPRDVRGRLDVRQVSFDPRPGTPVWTIRTFASWRPGEIWDRGFVVVFLDTMGTPKPDFFALIRPLGSRLRATLWRDPRTGRDYELRSLPVTRSSGDEVTVGIPLTAVRIGPSRASFGWWVATMFTGDRCRRTCVDHVPNQGAITQDLGAPTPSATATTTSPPTSSPTPSPTPSPTSSPTSSPSSSPTA
jgi:hypothetical protein